MDYELASALVRASLGSKRWGSGASESDVRAAEHQLRIVLPMSYKMFLQEFGWLEIEGLSVNGLGVDVPSHINLVSETLAERNDFQPYLPQNMLPLMNDGGGNLSCLDSSKAEPCPVVNRFHETGEFFAEADDFPSWLSDLVRTAIR